MFSPHAQLRSVGLTCIHCHLILLKNGHSLAIIQHYCVSTFSGIMWRFSLCLLYVITFMSEREAAVFLKDAVASDSIILNYLIVELYCCFKGV